jgi:hypothetical protein
MRTITRFLGSFSSPLFFQRQGQDRLLIDKYEGGNLIFSSGLPDRVIVYLIESSWRPVHLLKAGDERYWRSFVDQNSGFGMVEIFSNTVSSFPVICSYSYALLVRLMSYCI